MDDKYFIFNRTVYLTPLSIIDKHGNCRALECNENEAIEYVEQENQKLGEPRFYHMSIIEWQEKLKQSSEFFEEYDKTKEEISRQLLENSELQKIIDANNQKMNNNINGFSLPISVKNNEEYREKVEQILMEYSSTINKPAFESENNLISDVKLICKGIIDILDLAIAGHDDDAEMNIADLLRLYANHEFGVSALDKSYAFRGVAPFEKLHSPVASEDHYRKMMSGDLTFFRGRVVDKHKNEEVEKLEHIISLPYSKKHFSKDLRFSSKGEVCLYLGTTSYVCGQECRWDKQLQNLYMAAFRFNDKGKKLRILNLAISEPLINGIYHKGLDNDEYTRQLQGMMIKLFPLIIATSFTVKTSDKIRENQYGEEIKYEYLLTQRLIKAMKRADIDGVAYLSRQGKNDLQYPHGVNLAIPMSDIDEVKEYSDLYQCFEITKPVLVNHNNFNIETPEIEVSYINKYYTEFLKNYGDLNLRNIMEEVYCEEKSVFYGKTPFSKLDNYLVNQKYDCFEI